MGVVEEYIRELLILVLMLQQEIKSILDLDHLGGGLATDYISTDHVSKSLIKKSIMFTNRLMPLSTHRALQSIKLSHNITSQGQTPNSPSKNNLVRDNIIRKSQSEK